MRIEHVEQRFDNFGKLIVQLSPDAGSQQGEGLDQALDVRVGTVLARFQLKPSSDFRVFLGKLGGRLPKEGELLLVVPIQFIAHRPESTWKRRDSLGTSAS